MDSIASDEKRDFIKISKWRDMPCSWIIRLGIVKTFISSN